MPENRNRFNIRYRQEGIGLPAYYVSIPNYDGGEVVTATYHDKVVANLSSLLRAAGLQQVHIDNAIKEA